MSASLVWVPCRFFRKPLPLPAVSGPKNLCSSAPVVTCPRLGAVCAKITVSYAHQLGLQRSFSQCAAVGQGAASAGVPPSVPVREAQKLLQAGHRYLDVRTTEEFRAGHAPGAANVPYMLRSASGMSRNPRFLEEVVSHFEKDDEILVGCQVGKRSLMAATDLLSAGFSGVTDVAGGYASWVENGLPVES